MELTTIRIEKPDTAHVALGQAHNVKTIEDMHEALLAALPGIVFGIAFCEAAGKRLVRCVGSDDALLELAKKNAAAIGAGDMFIVLFTQPPDPRDVLTRIKSLAGVSRIYCATANPTEVVVATTEQGRGIIGIVDGSIPNGVETAEDIAWRRDYLLHTVGYRK